MSVYASGEATTSSPPHLTGDTSMKMTFRRRSGHRGRGMAFEARIAKGAGVRAVYGQKREVYLQKLTIWRAGARGIISFGVAVVFRRC